MSSGFVSEKELAEARLKRQEEWEKIRTADQPLEVPEEKYDPRSLFERLEEQRKKRDMEFEESRKLKNMIKGLDDDEIDFLDLVDQKKMEAERNKTRDEERELLDYRNRVANLQEKSMEQRLQAELKNIVKKQTTPNNLHLSTGSVQRNSNRLSQNQLLKGGLVIKKNPTENREKTPIKRKLSTEKNEQQHIDKKLRQNCEVDSTTSNIDERHLKITPLLNGNNEVSSTTSPINGEKISNEPILKCIGILPGMGYYDGNSTSDSDAESSDIEDVVYAKVKYDLTGRKIEEKNEDDA